MTGAVERSASRPGISSFVGESLDLAPRDIARLALLGLTAAISAAISAVVWWTFPHLGFVKELTVSSAISADINKLRDTAIVPIALGAQFIVFTVACWTWTRAGRFVERLLQPYVLRASLLVLAGLSYAVVLVVTRHFEALLAATMFALAALALQRRKQIAKVGFAAALILGAVAAFVANHLFDAPVSLALPGTVLAVAMSFSLAPISERLIVRVAGGATLVIAAAIALWLPSLWIPAALGRHPSMLDGLTLAMAAAVAVAGGLSLQAGKPDHRSGITALAMAGALLVVTTFQFDPFQLPTDDYHFGETLLATKAVWDGWGLFDRFYTPHGLSDVIGGLGAWLLGDESATGVQIGLFYGFAAMKLVVFWMLVRSAPPFLAALVALALPDSANVIVPLFAMTVVVETGRLRHDLAAGALCTLACAFGVFLAGGQGVSVVVPAFLIVVLLLRRWDRRSLIRFLTACAVTSLAVGALFWRQMLGEVRFLAISAASNLDLYGNNLIGPSYWAPRIQIATSFAFILLPLFALMLVSWRIGPNRTLGLKLLQGAAATVPILALVLLSAPYAMGRLDDTGIRAYFATIIAVFTLAVAWVTAPRLRRLAPALTRRGVLVCQFSAGLLLIAVGSPSGTYADSWGKVDLMPWTSASHAEPVSAQIPALGFGKHDPAHRARVEAVKSVADARLKPGETYLDLTNRNALYFYLDRKSPVPVPSMFNAGTSAFEDLDLEAVRRDPPPLALASVENLTLDGYALPLRDFEIYRYVLIHYRPFKVGDYIYAAWTSTPNDPLRAEEVDLWAEAFHQDDLGRAPSAWGRSMKALRKHMRAAVVALQVEPRQLNPAVAREPSYKVVGKQPQFRLRPTGRLRPGAGLLHLNLSCTSGQRLPPLRIYWRGLRENFATERSVRFEASYVENLVPLDSSPRWLLAPDIHELLLTFVSDVPCPEITLSGVSMRARK